MHWIIQQRVFYLWNAKTGYGDWWCTLSKSLNKTEKNYEIHDKEMLAMIRGLENWRHLLKSAHFKFKV